MWAAVAIAFVAMQAWALAPVDIVALAAVFLSALRIVECIGIAVPALVGVANVCQGCPRTVAPPFVVALAGAAVLAVQEWLITRLCVIATCDAACSRRHAGRAVLTAWCDRLSRSAVRGTGWGWTRY